MVLVTSRVQVHKGHMICDCFGLMASTTEAGTLFVCGLAWRDLEQDIWVYVQNIIFQSMTQMWKLCLLE